MDMKYFLDKAKETKNLKDEQREVLHAESIKRRINTVIWATKKVGEIYAPKWFMREEEKVAKDIESFFIDGADDGKSLVSYLDDGKIKVKYGNFTKDSSIAKKSYGCYVLSLEEPIGPDEASKFAHVLIITIMANNKLSKVLNYRLGVDISRLGCEKMLNEEKDMVLTFNFVPIKVFAKKVGKNTEPIVLGKTDVVIGKETLIEVSVLGYAKDGVAYITRTDWFDSDGLPQPFKFDLSYVYVPKE